MIQTLTSVSSSYSGLILPGVTRRSVIELAREFDEFEVNERKITIKDILNGAQNGTLVEMFGTGTAAIVTSVGNIYYDGKMHPLPVPEAENSFAQRYLALLLSSNFRKICKIICKKILE